MEKRPPYSQSPIMARISNQIFTQRNPAAFAIVNLGDGPLLASQNNWCHTDYFVLHLICGNQAISFSQNSQPPYYLAVCKEKGDAPLLVSLYQSGPNPLFETEVGDNLTGHIIAHAQSLEDGRQLVAQAVVVPQRARVFTNITRRDSLLLEGHPELCNHLLLCSTLIETLMIQHQDEQGRFRQ